MHIHQIYKVHLLTFVLVKQSPLKLVGVEHKQFKVALGGFILLLAKATGK